MSTNKVVDFYIIELSSFQLDLSNNIPLEAATVLNISYDHLERYADYESYIKTKLTIYKNSKNLFFNNKQKFYKDYNNTVKNSKEYHYGSKCFNPSDFCLTLEDNFYWLSKGKQKFIREDKVKFIRKI